VALVVPAVPTVSISPTVGLHDGQTVTVQVHGFAREDKAFLSECASASAANGLGCGKQLGAQPFIVTDDQGDGSSTFCVHTTAYAMPYDLTDTVTWRGSCVLVATDNVAAHAFADAPLSFG